MKVVGIIVAVVVLIVSVSVALWDGIINDWNKNNKRKW